MGGFIASNEAGITTTLGRGGSDFHRRAHRRRALAEAIEIWTDVDGIMTADPRVCPDALRVKVISFEEAAELAYFGAKVLHPATILPAVKKNIPVLVLNSRNAACEGTRITSLAPHCKSPFKSIAVKKKLSIIDVVASRMLMTHGYLKEIFHHLRQAPVPVDMVSTSEVSVSLTVDSNDKLPAIAADLSKLADVKYEGRKALVCMVGEDIRGQSGMAAQVFNAIRHINVRMISQGASEINMSFMIDEDDADEAVRSLHAAFFKDPDPAIFDVEARNLRARRLRSRRLFLACGRALMCPSSRIAWAMPRASTWCAPRATAMCWNCGTMRIRGAASRWARCAAPSGWRQSGAWEFREIFDHLRIWSPRRWRVWPRRLTTLKASKKRAAT
jgi:aspartate kinase